MRAPGLNPGVVPTQPYTARFSAPNGPSMANAIGGALVAGGADLGRLNDWRSVMVALGEDTAGRARALQDRATLDHLIATHAGLQGGDAVAAQPQAIDEIDRIRALGQASLGSPGMVAAYDQHLDPAIEYATSRITGHALQQMGVERQAVADQTMAAAQQSAAAAWQDPSRFVQGLGQVHALAIGQASPEAGDAERTAVARSAVGATVAKAIGQALGAGEPDFAAHIVGGWGDTLTPAAYQVAVARLGQSAQAQRMQSIFAQAAGGNPAPGPGNAQTLTPPPDMLVMDAPAGAAIHPVAGGVVSAIEGAPDNATVRILHPDGSSTAYGGLGLGAVTPGDLVTPAHAIGSAGPQVTMTATTPTGEPADALTLLSKAGGPAALIGTAQTARNWDEPTMLDRIAQRQDISSADRALAANLAQRRMAADRAQQTLQDLAAGRAVVALAAAVPGTAMQAADLPHDLVAQMTPATLASIDGAMRGAAQTATLPAPDNATALRLELLQRQAPAQFSQINLAPLIGLVHPADLSKLADNQARIAAGQPAEPGIDVRSAILDAMAHHEFGNSASLPDQALPAITTQAETLLRLGRVNLADRPLIDSAVADAIQTHGDSA